MINLAVGIVVIGRNEGERLATCLKSVIGAAAPVIYVDSGSIDGSVELAKRLGADVLELDCDTPYTAARARNAGFKRLVETAPTNQFVQFVDGDCELLPTWLPTALEYLQSHGDVAATCGRLRERFPDASPYNRLCDMEWDTPVGETDACGGVALMKVGAFAASGGFAADMIAGEEPDLCFRLRKAGWRIVRLDHEMAWHDAAMFRFGQWWRRAQRSGYADMEAYRRRGQHEPGLRRKVWSNILWALPPAWLLWPLLWLRVYRRNGALYATHVVAGKLPHARGQISYVVTRWLRAPSALIEYK